MTSDQRACLHLLIVVVIGCALLAISHMLLGCGGDTSYTEREGRVQVDGWTQAGLLPYVDVLIVLDQSGSMTDDRMNVSAGLLQLAFDLNEAAEDWSITIVPATPMLTQVLGPYTPDSPDVYTRISQAPYMMMGQGSVEVGYPPVINWLGTDIYDPYAPLLVVWVSDEDEQSGIGPEYMAGWMQTAKPRGVPIDPIAIVNTKDCGGNGGTIGHSYMELMRLYGKEATDLCTPGWEGWIASMSLILGARSEIQLTLDPIEDTIAVFVDWAQVTRWWYDGEYNMVRLLDTPEPGSAVFAVYEVAE